MKRSENLIEQLKTLPYFSKDTIIRLGEQMRLVNATIDTYISRFLKRKEIIRLKKGLYVSADFFDKNKSDISYQFYLANIIRPPSYVSSWAALQYYNLATETTYIISSVTPKITRMHKTKAGNFSYQSIKKELFSDYSLIKGRFDFFLASPSKALFDLLYFKTRQFRSLWSASRSERLKEIDKLVKDLRIEFNEMDKVEKKKFYLMIERYIRHE